MGKRYRNMDPYWLEARFASECTCGAQIKKGDKIFYYPRGKMAVCEACGDLAEDENRLEQSMDRFGTDCMYDY